MFPPLPRIGLAGQVLPQLAERLRQLAAQAWQLFAHVLQGEQCTVRCSRHVLHVRRAHDRVRES